MGRLKLYQVDAFTNKPFRGNPAAVCILEEPRSDEWLREVAREMNLSETAFLLPEGDVYRLRWFTPAVEVDLCGHATIASAHVLWETGLLPLTRTVRFHTRSGLLTADREDGWITLDFPVKVESEAAVPPGLLEALGVEQPLYVGKNAFDYVIEVESEDIVRQLTPDFAAIKPIPVRGVIVTSQAAPSSPYDIVSRFFAPAVGVNEDPVTGSAHSCLASYWSSKLGKSELLAYQASERGGELKLKLAGDRVLMSGQAVTVSVGHLLV